MDGSKLIGMWVQDSPILVAVFRPNAPTTPIDEEEDDDEDIILELSD